MSDDSMDALRFLAEQWLEDHIRGCIRIEREWHYADEIRGGRIDTKLLWEYDRFAFRTFGDAMEDLDAGTAVRIQDEQD